MRKLTVLLAICCLFAAGDAFSQFKAGFGFIGGLPSGDFGDIANFGAGGYIEAKYGVTDKIYPGIQVAFLGFAGADFDAGIGVPISFSATTMIPILITGDYYFLDGKIAPYAGIGLGPYIISSGVVDPFTGVEIDVNNTEFGFSPHAGVMVGKFNLGVAYHLVSDTDFFAFNLGFLFGS